MFQLLTFEVRWLIQYNGDAHDLIITISDKLTPEQIGGHFTYDNSFLSMKNFKLWLKFDWNMFLKV